MRHIIVVAGEDEEAKKAWCLGQDFDIILENNVNREVLDKLFDSNLTKIPIIYLESYLSHSDAKCYLLDLEDLGWTASLRTFDKDDRTVNNG